MSQNKNLENGNKFANEKPHPTPYTKIIDKLYKKKILLKKLK